MGGSGYENEEEEMIRARAYGVPAALVAAAAGLLIGAPVATGAGGPVIPGGAYGGNGVTGPEGQPSAAFRYLTVDTDGAGTLVEKIATDGGTLASLRRLSDPWTLPAVTISGDASGLSADGDTLILIRPYEGRAEQTRMLALNTRRLQQSEKLVLDGRFSFDAISPDGGLIYLVEYENPRNPLDYRVRAYDLAADEFLPGKIVDPEKPDEQMTGQPIARQTSPDGRWAYTLYGGGRETFIHALDTQEATAVCVDLEQFGPRDLYRLGLEADPASGALTVLLRGDPAAVVDPETFEVGSPPSPADPIADADGGGWAGWAAAGGGLALVAGGAFLLLRRRRRNDDSVDEEALERLVRIDAASTGEDRECEPVL